MWPAASSHDRVNDSARPRQALIALRSPPTTQGLAFFRSRAGSASAGHRAVLGRRHAAHRECPQLPHLDRLPAVVVVTPVRVLLACGKSPGLPLQRLPVLFSSSAARAPQHHRVQAGVRDSVPRALKYRWPAARRPPRIGSGAGYGGSGGVRGLGRPALLVGQRLACKRAAAVPGGRAAVGARRRQELRQARARASARHQPE